MDRLSLQALLMELTKICEKWVRNRKHLIQRIEEIIKEMEKHRNNTNIGKLSGGIGGFISGGLGITGCVLIPFTGKCIICDTSGDGSPGYQRGLSWPVIVQFLQSKTKL